MGTDDQRGWSLLSTVLQCQAGHVPSQGTFTPLLPQLQPKSSGVSVLSPLARDMHSRSCLNTVWCWSGAGDLSSSPWSLCHQHFGVLGHLTPGSQLFQEQRCCSPRTQSECVDGRSTGRCCWLGAVPVPGLPRVLAAFPLTTKRCPGRTFPACSSVRICSEVGQGAAASCISTDISLSCSSFPCCPPQRGQLFLHRTGL